MKPKPEPIVPPVTIGSMVLEFGTVRHDPPTSASIVAIAEAIKANAIALQRLAGAVSIPPESFNNAVGVFIGTKNEKGGTSETEK